MGARYEGIRYEGNGYASLDFLTWITSCEYFESWRELTLGMMADLDGGGTCMDMGLG